MSVEIIAEIANAHQGDPAQALELARQGFAGGADAVKFQIYFAEEFMVRRHPRYEHFKAQSFDKGTWHELIATAKPLGPVYCDVFGMDAIATAATAGADGFKVHASDTCNLPMLEAIAETGKTAFLSAGGTTVAELAAAVRILAGKAERIVLLHGFQNYPTALEDTALERLAWLRRTFGEDCAVGYMDHIDGADEFAYILPLMAMAAGATVIEKHITLDRGAKGVDYYSSIDVADLPRFIAMVRAAETATGPKPERFADAERHYRDTVKKHWVAARPLPRGHRLEIADLVMKRVPDVSGNSVEAEKLIGRALVRDVDAEQRLSRADVECTVWALPVARLASSRLPDKAIMEIAGMPALAHLIERLKRIDGLDKIVLCTTTGPEDDPIEALGRAHGVAVFRGQSLDVLGRMLGAVGDASVDVALRVTGDDILVDPDYAGRAIGHHLEQNAEYTDAKTLPSGMEVEVFDVALLRRIHELAVDPDGTEYLTNYVTDNADQFRIAHLPVDEGHARDWRLTLDTAEDAELIARVLEAMRDAGKPVDYTIDDVAAFLAAHPEALALNAGVRQRAKPIAVDTRLDWRALAAGRSTAP